jgi:HK97 family phage prohead protease
MKRHERHDYSLKVNLDPAGSFTGIAAVYNVVDLGGDRIVPGAFARTLAASKVRPLLWQHQSETPIGTITVTDSRDGLQVAGQLLMDLPAAKNAYTLIKAGVIKGLSIGYDTIQEAMEDGVRLLKEVRLWEVSIVTFPMSLGSAIGSVKSMSADDLTAHLQGVRRAEKGIRFHTKSLRMHMKAILGDPDDLGDDDDIDDEPLFEGDDDGDDKAFLVELQKLAEQAQELAEA